MSKMGSEVLEQFRKPLVKILTRLILYGLTVLCGYLGLSGEEVETTTGQVACGVASLIFLAVAQQLDRWHHKKDRSQS